MIRELPGMPRGLESIGTSSKSIDWLMRRARRAYLRSMPAKLKVSYNI